MSSFFKGYYEIWSINNKILNRYEKDILITLIGYWKRATEEFHYNYMQLSYRNIMRAMGETDPHLIQKYVLNLQEKGLLQIINIEDVMNNHHVPKFVLKEENINVFFKGNIFKTGKQENKPGCKPQSSTNPFKKKNTGEATKEKGAPPDRQATLDYITLMNQRIKKVKEERNALQKERRKQTAEESAFLWD